MAETRGVAYDPFKGIRSALPVSTTSDKSIKSIMAGLRSVETSKKAIKALGGKPAEKRKPGPVEKLFSQETGVLAAPFRFVSALIGEAIGFDDDDLRSYNPIESAVRSARGEFAITGGDLFKVDPEDNILERLPKYVAAFGFDVAADPLSYLGGTGVFSRAGGARLLTDEVVASKILDDAVRIVESKGKSGAELITTLANRRRLASAGKEIGDPRRLAALELGDIIGETFLTSSRGNIVKNLTRLFNDEDVARQLFTQLPDEIRGGLFVKNPITGRPIVRISGGKGYSNTTIDTLNQWRANLAGSAAGRALTKNFGGKVLGPGLAAVKYGLITTNRDRLGDFARTRLSDVTQLRSALFNRAADIRNIPVPVLRIADDVTRAVSQMSPEDAVKFRTDFSHFFQFPKDITDEATPEITKAAKAMADQLRVQLDELSEMLRQAGVDIGYQADFSPLKYSDAELERLGRIDPRQGPDTRDRYRGDLRRVAYVEPVSVKELDDLSTEIVTRAMTPSQANELLGREVFETDPLKIMTFYTDWAARTIANARMVRALEATGVLTRFPAETVKMLNVLNAKHYTSAVTKLTPEAVRRATEAEESLTKELNTMVSKETLDAREAQRAARIETADTTYRQAKELEAAKAAEIAEADAFIRTFEPDVGALQRTLENYGGLKLEALRDKLKAMRVSQKRRAARLQAKQARLAAGTDEATYVAQDLADTTQSIRELEDEIDEVRSIIDDASGELAAVEVDNMRTYVDALQRKRELTAELEGLRNNRRVAKRDLDAARADVTIPRGQAVEIVVNTAVQARRNYLDYVATLRNVPKSQWTAEQVAEVARLKAVSDDARKIMKDTLGFAGRKAKQPGRAFAAQIVDLADRLTSQQMSTARVIADAEKLGDFIQTIGYAGASRDAATAAMGDLMRTYRSIRAYVSKADLDMLNINERAVYEGLAEVPVYEKAERKYTAKLEKLEADLKAAHVRGADPDEIEKLERQIDLVHKLASDDGLRIIGADKQVRLPAEMKDVYASAGVRNILETMYRIEQDPSDFEKFISKIYDPLALLWKTGVTVGRGPAYTLVNTLGGLLNNYIGGVGAQEHAIAAKVISTLRSTINETKAKLPNATERELMEAAENAIRRKLAGINVGDYSAIEVFEKFLESGSWWTTDTVFQMQELRRLGLLAGETGVGQREQVMYRFEGEPATNAENSFRRVTNFMLTNPVQRMFNDMAQQSELFLRFAAFAHGYKRFGSRDAAIDMVRMLHFDYQDLSDAELWIKRLVPFYTWTRHNIPLQIRAMFMQQDKIRKMVAGNAELEAALGVDDEDSWLNEILPDFVDANSGFASYLKFGGNHLALYPKLPMQDVDRLLQVKDIGGIPIVVPRIREFGAMVGPAVAPLEFVNQTNFDTGQKFASNEEMVWQMSRSLIPYIGTAGRIVSSATLPLQAAGVDLSMAGDSFGAKVYNQFVAPDKASANLFNFLVGAPVGVSTLTEKAVTGGLIEYGKVQSKELKKLADAADVDVEWLRKQVRDGVSLTEIRWKIASGQGKRSRVEKERQARANPPISDYMALLNRIERGGL